MSTTSKTYANLQLGADLYRREEYERARGVFEDILEENPDNPEALANLALIEARITKDYDQALAWLQDAKTAVEGGSPEGTWTERPTWYQVMYSIAANQLHKALPKGAIDKRASAASAEATARQLALRTFDTLESGKGSKEFRLFLEETLEPSTLVLLAGAIVESSDEAIDEGLRDAGVTREDVRLALEKDGQPSPNLLVTFVSQGKFLPYRVEYNLACYLAGASRRTKNKSASATLLQKSVGRLERSFKRAPRVVVKDLVKWAVVDPSLEPLRSLDEFAALVTRFNPLAGKTRGSSWATLRAIGPTHAANLSKHGINSLEGLRNSTRTRRDRQRLAKTLSVTDQTIERWTDLIDLLELEDLDVNYGNLLERAGIFSLRSLGTWEAKELAAFLRDVNAAEQIVHRLPGRDQVATWIKDARKRSPRRRAPK